MKYRNYPGEREENFRSWPLKDVADMDAFALSQYIQLLVKNDPVDIEKIIALPDATQEELWQYEHLRQFCIDANALSVEMAQECTCPSMTTGTDKIFLCAAHQEPKECTAINYCFHIIDSSAATLTNLKIFPSRLLITESASKHLISIAKRIYRIFAHASVFHRGTLLLFEAENHTFKRFLRFNVLNNLIPKDAISEAEIEGFEQYAK